jgi:hypothetical protein
MTSETDQEITGQLLSNFSYLSTATLWNESNFFTSFTYFTLQTTMRKLTDKPTIMTDYGKLGLYLTQWMRRTKKIYTKCEEYDVGLCTVGSFKEYHTKARFSYMMHGRSLYTHQRDNKKRYVHCILLCLKINIWECVGSPQEACAHASTSSVQRPDLQNCLVWSLQHYLSVCIYACFGR